MNLFLILLIPIGGLLLAGILMQFTGRTTLKGYDILPFFFILAIELLMRSLNRPTYLPYGFLYFFIFVIGYSIYSVIKNKNIWLKKLILSLWRFLAICSFGWLIGLIFVLFI